MSTSTKTHIICLLLILLTGWNARAQFIMQVNGAGTVEPRIFKDNASSGYYLTGMTNNTTYITYVNANGIPDTCRNIKFNGDPAIIKDLIVDFTDGTLAGVAEGTSSSNSSNTYIFRYDFTSASFVWLTAYPKRALQLVNIHQTGANTYVVTGQQKYGPVFLGEVNSSGGTFGGFQEIGFYGEFFSAYDGNDIYGAGGHGFSPTMQNATTFRYGATTGVNAWTNTYLTSIGGSLIHSVAPIVDNGEVVVLSSGDATGSFNTYQTGPTDVWLHKTDLAGNLLWTKSITIPGYTNLHAKQVINTATGYYLLIDNYLTGTPGFEDFFFIVKTDKGGNLVWANRYGIQNLNKVISAIEVNNGELLVTASSQSYLPYNLTGTLLLKLDLFGMACNGCNFITPWTANISNAPNLQQPLSFTPFSASIITTNFTATTNTTTPLPVTRCGCGNGGGSGTGNPPPGGFLPCNSLAGSLNMGVIAFYPFGFGSLLDVSSSTSALNLNNTGATPTFDRNNMPCAYRFQLNDYLWLTPAQTTAFDNITTGPFSISLWYQPLGIRPIGDFELLVGRGSPTAVAPGSLHCPDTWQEWSVGLHDCRKVVMGADHYCHWETPASSLSCTDLLAAISDNWHHLAVTHDGFGNFTIYVDNVPYSNNSGPCGQATSNILQLVLGKDYNGDLDDVIIYNRELLPSEVSSLSSWPASSCCDGMYSAYKPAGTATVTNENHDIKLYPNPTDGRVSVLTDGTMVKEVSVYDVKGTLVNTYSFNKINPSFDIAELPAGVYVIKVKTEKGESVEKLIKK